MNNPAACLGDVVLQVPWSHHGVIGNREKVVPIEMKVSNTWLTLHISQPSEVCMHDMVYLAALEALYKSQV